ncbi:MAG: hypothetical protein ACXVKH_00745 [Candidatus Angelobacter sp.]
MRFYELVIGVLSVWRLSHLLTGEDGPWGAFARVRVWAGTGLLGNLLDCFYCLSLWISGAVMFLFQCSWKERILLWLGCSAGAILLERITSQKRIPLPPIYVEDQEHQNVL